MPREIIYSRVDRENQHCPVWISDMLLLWTQRLPEEKAMNMIYLSDRSNQPLNELVIWTSLLYYPDFVDGILPSGAL